MSAESSSENVRRSTENAHPTETELPLYGGDTERVEGASDQDNPQAASQEERLAVQLDHHLQTLQNGSEGIGCEFVGHVHPDAQFDDLCPIVEQLHRLSSFLRQPSAPTTNPPPAQAEAAPPTPQVIPATIGGKFQVKQVLGRGGQATVYKVFDPALKRHVVVKVYHAARDHHEQEIVLKEGQTLAQVNSPFVARCLSAERHEGAPCLVMEYVAGQSLDEYHRRRKLSVVQSLELIAKVAEGLTAIQRRGLLHRDIKPANILVGDDDAPRLVDFGLAAPLASEDLKSVSGTLAYMAPEQARGEYERVGPSSDVFGVGAVLYELLTNQPPHIAASFAEMLQKARGGDITPPIEIDPSIPAEVNNLCMRCLAKDLDRRPDSANELLREIRITQASLAPSPWTGRRIAAVAACAVVAAVMGFVLFAVFGSSSTTQDETPPVEIAKTDELRKEMSPLQPRLVEKAPVESAQKGDLPAPSSDAQPLPSPNDAGAKMRRGTGERPEAVPGIIEYSSKPLVEQGHSLNLRPPAPTAPSKRTGVRFGAGNRGRRVRGAAKHPDGRTLRQDFPVSIQLIGATNDKNGKAIISQGREITLRIESTRDGYVGVWSLQDGGALQILPNKAEKDHRLRAGQARLVPGEPDDPQQPRQSLTASTVSKEDEYLHVIVATKPLPPVEGSQLGPYVVLDKPQNQGGYKITTRGLSLVDEADKSLQISEAIIPYRVVAEKPTNESE